MIEKLCAGTQYLLTHLLLSSLVHAVIRIRLGPVKAAQISLIGGAVGVDWGEARSAEISDYDCFNDFFTRELKEDARPIDPDPVSYTHLTLPTITE
mgnify:CR=1 FL=1